MSKQVKELIGNMQRRTANQRAEIERLRAKNANLHASCTEFERKCASLNDVVEVVRCKDCKYSEIDEDGNTWCTFYNGKIREMPNGYCWHGERSE